MTHTKTIRHGLVTAMALTAACLTGLAQADDEQIQRGKAAAGACVACHQADGNGLSQEATSWPRLAGLPAAYLDAQLHAFKSGERESAEMKPFATMLDDDQIADVSAYFSSLPAKLPAATETFSDETLARGEQLALSGDWNRYIMPCISCHGPANQGVGESFPGIAGQHYAYLNQQLHDWKDGKRTGDPLDLMHAVSKRLDESDMDAVSTWLSTQQPAPSSDSE